MEKTKKYKKNKIDLIFFICKNIVYKIYIKNMLNLLKKPRSLSNLACNNFYTETDYLYNQKKNYFEEFYKTFNVNRNKHECVSSTGDICKICKGHGIIFNTTSVIDFNYYRLCENCKGTGLV